MEEKPRLLLDLQVGADTVRVILDGGEELEIAPGSLPSGIPADGSGIGGSISSPLLAELRLAAERKKVARRIFTLLDRRLMPLARIRRKMQDEGYGDEAVDAVLDQMEKRGIYSDRAYAAAYCRDCLATRQVGRNYLEKKLREKQVAGAVARAVAAEVLSEEMEAELAREAARKKWRSMRGPADSKAEQKVARYLQGRGFPPRLVWEAVRFGKAAQELDDEGG